MAFNFKVYQLNCHHSRLVHISLEADLPQNSSYICLLQEPYIYEGNVCGLDRSRVYFVRDVDTRVAIYTSPDLKLIFHTYWYIFKVVKSFHSGNIGAVRQRAAKLLAVKPKE